MCGRANFCWLSKELLMYAHQYCGSYNEIYLRKFTLCYRAQNHIDPELLPCNMFLARSFGVRGVFNIAIHTEVGHIKKYKNVLFALLFL